MQKREYRYLFAGYEAVITSRFYNQGTIVKPSLRITKTTGKGFFAWSDIHFSHNDSVKKCKDILAQSMRVSRSKIEHYRITKADL